jgi:dephospho-CoA kinase
MDKKILAIVGGSITGKGVVVDLLVGNGYKAFSGGDILREIATQRGISHNRADLIALSQELRSANGGDYLIREAIERMQHEEGSKFVFDSIRNPVELRPLINAGGFVLGVEASDDIRLQMSIARKRPGDPTTLQELLALKKREGDDGQGEFGQNVDGLMLLADVVLQNDSTVEVFRDRLESELIPRGFLELPTRRERF